MLLIELDDIIVDYGISSRAAAAQAAGAYLQEVCAVDQGTRLVPQHLMDTFKRSGGFERDDDMVYALVYFFLNTLPRIMRPPSPYKPIRRAKQIHKAFKAKDIRFNALFGHSERPMAPILTRINQCGGGKEGIRRMLGDGVIEKYILDSGLIGATEQEAALGEDVDKATRQEARERNENLISRLYQEHYLGDEGFTSAWGVAPMAPRGEGMRQKEALLYDRALLEEIASLSLPVLFVNQPEAQVNATLERLGLLDVFPVVLHLNALEKAPANMRSLEDATSDQPTLYNLWTLRQLVEQGAKAHGVSPNPKKTTVLGRSDLWLSLAGTTNMRTIGLVREREERKRFKELGASAVIGKLETLVKKLKQAAR